MSNIIPLIDIQEIYKIYSTGDTKVYALKNINLQIYKSEFISIVGQSGSGKSTLMNILGCLDTPTHGKYLLDGNDIATLNDKALSRIRNEKVGFIFQGFNLIPNMTAIENVELPLIYRGISKYERKKLAIGALEQVCLSHRINHLPAEMSGGQQQRVAIARAIASKPSIILADEPTGNLDSKSGDEVIKILNELNKDGHTIVLITHDNNIASQTRHIIRIQDGIITDNISRCVNV